MGILKYAHNVDKRDSQSVEQSYATKNGRVSGDLRAKLNAVDIHARNLSLGRLQTMNDRIRFRTMTHLNPGHLITMFTGTGIQHQREGSDNWHLEGVFRSFELNKLEP
jgi:hypothetical protein